MIRFLVTRAHAYTFDSLVHGRFGRMRSRLKVIPYESFLEQRRVPHCTYVFTDIDRLSARDSKRAGEVYLRLQDAGCLVLNDPARAASRYELLRKFSAAGVNDFEAVRADEHRLPSRYPVFLRFEDDHLAPVTELIHTAEELEREIEAMESRGIARRGILIVEYCGEPFEDGVYRKYSSFRVGDRLLAHHIVNQNHWVAKYGDHGVTRPGRYYEFERQFIEENRHADALRRAFEIARIDYGRADYGVVRGRVQIYEINTNPTLGRAPENPAFRAETLRRSNAALVEAFDALDRPGHGSVLIDPTPVRRRLRRRIRRLLPRALAARIQRMMV